ncbi:hypothetical protein CR513_49510, partial [Mucuna pruriens]
MEKIMEILQNLEATKGNEGSTSKAPKPTPDNPLGFTPLQTHNQAPFQPYGIPSRTIEDLHHDSAMNQ